MSEFVFDASPLWHFARAGHLGTLREITAQHRCGTTQAVLDELRRGEASHPELAEARAASWLETVRADELEVVRALVAFAPRLGADEHNIGELTVLAWCAVNDAVAILDDRVARNAAQHAGVAFRGSLALVAEGLRSRTLDEAESARLIDDLRNSGARLPCSGSDFLPWARRKACSKSPILGDWGVSCAGELDVLTWTLFAAVSQVGAGRTFFL